jgi:Asp-tRNA(Asn)/Glu-tRNA(Gln) amidotransferase A subunit family amidase
MPIGVQVVGRPFREDEVLSVAGMLDEEFGWKQPPLI